MRDLGPDDGSRLLIKMFAVPVRMLGGELIDLVIVLAHEQRLQRREPWILLRPHVARHHGAIGVERQIAPWAGLHRQLFEVPNKRRGAAAGVEHEIDDGVHYGLRTMAPADFPYSSASCAAAASDNA